MEDVDDNRVSIMRLHQTYDTEFAPNQLNNETFMAAAYDLYDGSSPYGRYFLKLFSTFINCYTCHNFF